MTESVFRKNKGLTLEDRGSCLAPSPTTDDFYKKTVSPNTSAVSPNTSAVSDVSTTGSALTSLKYAPPIPDVVSKYGGGKRIQKYNKNKKHKNNTKKRNKKTKRKTVKNKRKNVKFK